jgi:CubicO group peptidase (beta-lactamase class C family)
MNEPISSFLQSRINAGDFPSATYLIAEKGEIVFQDAFGYAVVKPEQIEAKVDTIYDLASVTKVLVLGLLLAKMNEAREVSLDDQIRKYIPAFDRSDKHRITIKNVLAHTAGFPDWRPFYLVADDRADVLEKIAETPLQYEIGTRVLYSDPGFSILTFLTEKLAARHLGGVAQTEIIEPLGLRSTFFNPPAEICRRTAASEFGNQFEREMCKERGYSLEREGAFRDYEIWGEVHDGNAYFMGGVAGHAGLFSTAEEVLKIAMQFLPQSSQLLKPETCDLFRTNFTKRVNEDRSLSFQLASTKDSTAGTKMSRESFGHNGFTGTSLWIDPLNERIFVLLTNRTHNHDLPFVNINSLRRRFHDLAVDALDN